MSTKKEIFERYQSEYLKANKKRKGEIIGIISEVVGMHKKSVIRRFRVLQMRGRGYRGKRGRPVYYTSDVTAALRTIWEASSEVCGELVHPVIEDYVRILKRDKMWTHTETTTKKLMHMSEMSVKRRISGFMRKRKQQKGLSSTQPSSLKTLIPLFTGPWKDLQPGYGQLDTVVHCGSSLRGDMVYTLNYTDVATMWVELRAQWNKGEQATKESLKAIRARLPFDLLGIHPDTGSEFINWNLYRWCQKEAIDFTRSRPGQKNDNAYVEERNNHCVRRFMGYIRIDTPETVAVINQLYDILAVYLNHFVASRKSVKKERIGSRYRRTYDIAQTPYQRVLAHQHIHQNVKDMLKEQHDTLNPLTLKNKVDRLIIKVIETQKHYGNRSDL